MTKHRLLVGALVLLLGASAAGNVVLFREASRPLFAERDRPLIERTIAHFKALEPASAEGLETDTFPIVLRLADRTCVELRHYGGLGHRAACYDRQDKLIEETASVVN